MSAKTAAAPRALASYPVSLQSAAAALWGEDFWGREKINPELPARPRLSVASGPSRSSA
jgi:hypothetical protein